MSSHDCSLRGSDLIIKREIKQEDVIEALRVFADDAGPGFTPDSVTFEDACLISASIFMAGAEARATITCRPWCRSSAR